MMKQRKGLKTVILKFQIGLLFIVRSLCNLVCFGTVTLTKSDSDEMFCLQLLSKTLTCTIHLSYANPGDRINTHVIYR